MYTVHRFWEQTGADQVHHFFPPVAEKSAEEHGEVCHLPHVYLCFSICLEFRVIFFSGEFGDFGFSDSCSLIFAAIRSYNLGLSGICTILQFLCLLGKGWEGLGV